MINKIIYYLSTIKTRTWVLICFLAILISPFLFSIEHTYYPFVLGEKSSWVGDAIGGITAPIIGFFSIILLYRTLNEQLKFNKSQYRFNKSQYEFNKRQDDFNTAQLAFAKAQKQLAFDEQFRTTFFNLLNIQRDIADKIRFVEKDQNVFISCFYALRLIFLSLDNKIIANRKDAFNSTVTYKDLKLSEYIYYVQDEGKMKPVLYNACMFFKITEDVLNNYLNKETVDEKLEYCYKIFFYKLSRIGVYFRHLYRILKYIDQTKEQEINLFYNGTSNKAIEEKYYNYAQLLQAQMSFEQLILLFYSSFKFKNMQKEIKNYGLLDNLYEGMLFSPEHNCIPEYNLKKKI